MCVAGIRVYDVCFGIDGVMLRFQGSGFRILDMGFRVHGVGFKIHGLLL